MIVLALATGLRRGWLADHAAGPAHNLTAAVALGWHGLAGRVGPDGRVAGVCMGTGVEP
eukprot:SAG11_NODE_20814_length_437_cov_1.508876_1_plen_58_part_10